MSKLVVLALDVAKHRTGWAVGSYGMDRPYWGVYELAGVWERHEGLRLGQWKNFLISKIEAHGANYLALERPFVDTQDFDWKATWPIFLMFGVALELAHERGIRAGAVSIQSWREHFLGTSKAPAGLVKNKRTAALKDMARRRALARGWLTQYHDEAEALGIMDYALFCLDDDYAHRTGPDSRRAELQAENAHYRGDAL